MTVLSVLVGFSITGNAQAAQHYNSVCHLHPGKGDYLVSFGQTIILSDRHPNNITKNVSIPAGKYKVVLEAFDGYKGRSKSDPTHQAHEQYYVKFVSGGRTIAQSGKTGDLRDRVEQAYWRGTVNNSITLSGNVTQVIAQHAVPYRNRYPNSLNPTCMLLERINDPINARCGSANGKTFSSKPTSNLCAVGGFTGVNGSGPWTWTCHGAYGGRDVTCRADIVSPRCGSANGQVFTSKPTNNLCSVGNSTTVTQTGSRFGWSCTNGSKKVNCGATLYIAECGNGKLDSGEQCDDDNTVNGDGCSAKCTIESASIKIVKDDNDNHNDKQTVEENGKATFTITVTNVGQKNLQDVVITDAKEADCNRSASQTKKLYSGDLFDAGESFTYTCVDSKVEAGYTNTAEVRAESVDGKNTVSDRDSTVITVKVPDPVCGNGKLESNEQCDDGNTVSGDGCSASCTIESKPEPKPTPKPEPKDDDEDEDDDGKIGNLVWFDNNKNCVQDPGEEGIAGVGLKLYKGNKVWHDITNAHGHYHFKDLKKGRYKLIVAQETLPEGCYQVCDPDGTKMDGKTKVKIDGDEYYKKADFGYYCPTTTPVVHQSSPQTGPGATAGAIAFVFSALSAGFVYRRNQKMNI